jgi:hypothetical protein
VAEFLFEGLDGANPLAYLAALGGLRTTAQTWPERNARLYWSSAMGGWRPFLRLDGELDRDDWLAALALSLRDKSGQIAFNLADDLTVPCPAYKSAATAAVADAVAGDRRHADFLAAFGSEIVESEANGKKTGQIADTAFRTMSGAGHQHFLGFMRELAGVTETEHLSRALFEAWRYTDPGPSMRWDPSDDRRYALRWLQPSGDPAKTVRGANRLAIEALPLLPTAPVGQRLETTGFTQRKGRGAVWTWPIWTEPANLDVVRSLMTLPELQKDAPDRQALTAMGIAEIYRSQRITQGKYRNFTPAQPT